MAEHPGRLEGKVAIVTGGSSGIGLASVERFVAEGASVVFCDLSPHYGAELSEQLGPAAARFHHTRRQPGDEHDGATVARRLGSTATFVAADVTDESALRSTVTAALDVYGQIDILFNNAGIGGFEGNIIDSSEDVFDRILAVNLKAVWQGIRLVAPHMLSRGGSILSTASAAALIGVAGLGAYSASKAAVIGMTRSAAIELAPHCIRVNCICPGRILTPISYDSPLRDAAVDPESLADDFRDGQPLPTIGLPRHIADAALWLASDESSFVTGQALVVDGGLTIDKARAETKAASGALMPGRT